jgi:hypothetical protein
MKAWVVIGHILTPAIGGPARSAFMIEDLRFVSCWSGEN